MHGMTRWDVQSQLRPPDTKEISVASHTDYRTRHSGRHISSQNSTSEYTRRDEQITARPD